MGQALAWFPFAWVERVAFLYHYLPTLLLSILSTGLVFDELTSPQWPSSWRGPWCGPWCGGVRRGLAGLLLLLALASFIYFAPQYMGWPLERFDSITRSKRLDPIAPSLSLSLSLS